MIEIQSGHGDEVAAFLRATDREAISTLYGFRVVWHEQTQEYCARDGEAIVGALRLRIAAAVGFIEALTVAVTHRRSGIGRLLLKHAEDAANYYNCHKVSLQVPTESSVKPFFLACGYRVEATLPQHAFKKDVDVLRKFLL